MSTKHRPLDETSLELVEIMAQRAELRGTGGADAADKVLRGPGKTQPRFQVAFADVVKGPEDTRPIACDVRGEDRLADFFKVIDRRAGLHLCEQHLKPGWLAGNPIVFRTVVAELVIADGFGFGMVVKTIFGPLHRGDDVVAAETGRLSQGPRIFSELGRGNVGEVIGCFCLDFGNGNDEPV